MISVPALALFAGRRAAPSSLHSVFAEPDLSDPARIKTFVTSAVLERSE